MSKDILIVDDEVEICLLLSGILQRNGFSTSYAHDLKNAATQVTENDFKLIFLDLNLPDGMGYDLFPLLKKQHQSKVIVISAHDSEAVKALEMGADHFIAKPFNRKTIINTIVQLNIA